MQSLIPYCFTEFVALNHLQHHNLSEINGKKSLKGIFVWFNVPTFLTDFLLYQKINSSEICELDNVI